MKKHVIFGVAALIAAAVPMSVKADADDGDCHNFVKAADGVYQSVNKGNDKGKWFCAEAEKPDNGVFGRLTSGDNITPRIPAFMKDNGIQ
jgi:hypothetical protein